MTTTVLF